MYGSYIGYHNIGRVGSRWCAFAGNDWWSRGLMIALAVIGITLVVLLIVNLSRRSYTQRDDDEALRILRKRFAQGEIDQETFENMRRNLR